MQDLKDMANVLRVHSIKMTDESNSGHPTSCCSMAELLSVLFFDEMKYIVNDPRNPNNDRFILSKGHAAPILYAAWAEVGLFPISDLLNLRKITSDLDGHPTPKLSFIDLATGSLGQGLGAACGMAYLGKYIEKSTYRIYCLMGDGEVSEGSIWEAAAFASFNKLDNLVAIIDINRLAQSDQAPLGHNIDIYIKRWSSFGFNCIAIDGHNIEEIINAFNNSKNCKNMPSIILAKTYKGMGIPNISDKDGFHGKVLGKYSEEAIKTISSLIINKNLTELKKNIKIPIQNLLISSKINIKCDILPNYNINEPFATRLAYGIALTKLGESNKNIIVLDADVKNSTFSDKFKLKFPERFVECHIAEQNMISLAIGISARNRAITFVSTFAAFLTRAYDQIRMGAISMTNIKICGSHVGISIGEDGPSQMALEDLAMFRSIPNCVVFYPSDAVSMEAAVLLAANTNGMAYIRSSRPANKVIYKNDQIFSIGKSIIIQKPIDANIVLIGAGVTLHEIIEASKLLEKHSIKPIIIDLFTIKPLDINTILDSARLCQGKIVTVEDHYKEGGIFEAVSSSLSEFKDISVRGIYINHIPKSGKPEELFKLFGIDAVSIVEKVKEFF